MKPEQFDYGGGVQQTMLHPVVLAGMVICALLVLTLPRKQIIVPFLLIALLPPLGQQVYFAGAHWLVLRIVIIVGCARMLLDKLGVQGKLLPSLTGVDKAFVFWAFYTGLAPIMLFRTSGIVVLRVALWIQTFGGYFLLRYLIQDVDDIIRASKVFALMALVFSLCMAYERFGGINVFGYLGGVSPHPSVRSGLIRAQASFGTPILSGCLGAALVPLFFWLWKGCQAKIVAGIGILSSGFMVYFSASSTPTLALVGGIVALSLWPIRRSMRAVRWGVVLTLVVISIAMKAPIWFLIARVNTTGSSDAYSRAMLIDNFVRHFADWWLIGTNQNGSWGFDMWDTCNGFVEVGQTGGLIALVAFIAMISRSFARLGTMRRRVEGDRQRRLLLWSLGAVMLAHMFCFFGVSYWDQTQIWWFATLAMISAATTFQARPIKDLPRDEDGIQVRDYDERPLTHAYS